ncbi:histidinol-phosphate transaminase [Marinobacteraceae bacterium S3BR75-40.1]
MTCDYAALATLGVQGLSPYQPGKPIDELARELGLAPDRIVKLASNENPLGPSPKAIEAVRRILPQLARYPDGNGFELKQKLAVRYGVKPEQLTLGNGSNDVLELIARAFTEKGREIVYSQHAFAVYPLVTQALGAQHVKVPARQWGHDLNAMAEAVTDNTAVIFIANPNNPTGTDVSRRELEAFLDRIPEEVVVVLDEAYGEYIDDPDYPDGLALLDRYPNLVVTRTFSKAWGLAGLRVGFAVSSPAIADVLNRVRQPFNVDTAALTAAVAVLDDADYLAESVAVNRAGLRQLQAGLEKLTLDFIPSRANFVAVDVGRDAQPVYEGLLQEGVIVRPVAAYEMPRHLRVSVGLESENARFLEALENVLRAQS